MAATRTALALVALLAAGLASGAAAREGEVNGAGAPQWRLAQSAAAPRGQPDDERDSASARRPRSDAIENLDRGQRRRLRQRIHAATPEQRQRFRERMRDACPSRCGIAR